MANRLGYAHLDTDNFYWMPTDPPFRTKRPPEDRLAMMTSAFDAAPNGWVLSGSLDGWGDPFIPRFSLVAFVYTPPATRMARLIAREHERYGAAVAPGGVMYDQHLEFVAWAEGYDRADRSGRSRPRHEACWRRCPARCCDWMARSRSRFWPMP